MPRLENWSVRIVADGFFAPELLRPSLQGVVYAHPRIEDGHRVVTSVIESIDAENKTVTTYSGSVYTLGAVDPAYEEEYPNAEKRFWEQDGRSNSDFVEVV